MRTGESFSGTFVKSSEKLTANFNHREFVSTETSANLSQLLLPALNVAIENEELLSLLGHEGYQLK